MKELNVKECVDLYTGLIVDTTAIRTALQKIEGKNSDICEIIELAVESLYEVADYLGVAIGRTLVEAASKEVFAVTDASRDN
jgi:hypothetical protein